MLHSGTGKLQGWAEPTVLLCGVCFLSFDFHYSRKASGCSPTYLCFHLSLGSFGSSELCTSILQRAGVGEFWLNVLGRCQGRYGNWLCAWAFWNSAVLKLHEPGVAWPSSLSVFWSTRITSIARNIGRNDGQRPSWKGWEITFVIFRKLLCDFIQLWLQGCFLVLTKWWRLPHGMVWIVFG